MCKKYKPALDPFAVWLVFLVTVTILCLFGCSNPTAEEEAAYRKKAEEDAKVKVQQLMDMTHACDNNGGIARIDPCYGRGCYMTDVVCKNGMMKRFEGRF